MPADERKLLEFTTTPTRQYCLEVHRPGQERPSFGVSFTWASLQQHLHRWRGRIRQPRA